MQGDIIVHDVHCPLSRGKGECSCGADEKLEGPVRLIWAADEQHIAFLARVSNTKAKPDDPAERLIAYLLRNHHWSPFEMVSMCVEINTTRDITNQIIRHRSFSFQEFSTRYADVEELVLFKECRFQDDKNRQNSFTLEDMSKEGAVQLAENEATIAYFDAVVNESRTRSMEAYQELRSRGVAKEVARCILPFGLLPSKVYMSGTVRSWIHYLSERTKSGVQKEHREVALAVARIFERNFPMVAEALMFTEFRHIFPEKEQDS